LKLSPEEKASRERERLIESAKADSLQTYRGKVARIFQRLVRAEAAAAPAGFSRHYWEGGICESYRQVGECVCITCGAVKPWNHKGMHAGHWIGRVHQSTLFEPDNLATQCGGCNEHRHGMQQEYLIWLQRVRGLNVVDRLLVLKHKPKSFTRDALVDMRIEFSKRLKVAVDKMK
jgi:hypothetical protein